MDCGVVKKAYFKDEFSIALLIVKAILKIPPVIQLLMY
jgi:hypothetical protein